MFKKFCTFLGVLVLIAGVALGGYMLYTKVLKDKLWPSNTNDNGETFSITYAYETTTSSKYDTEKYGFVKGYSGSVPETVVISASFSDNGVTRKVTGIKANAFANAKNLKSVEIPSTVNYFGINLFNGCDNLQTVIIKSQYSSGFSGAFDGLDLSKITFKVADEEVKNRLLAAYPSANATLDESLNTITD